MNRRDFIERVAILPMASLISLNSKSSEDVEIMVGTTPPPTKFHWNYVVYCYVRKQGEWMFTKNFEGDLTHQNKYLVPEKAEVYSGWMDEGKLYFNSFDEARHFIDKHVRDKKNINMVDSIYDIYFVESIEKEETQVAHFWFNGDMGRQIYWINNNN